MEGISKERVKSGRLALRYLADKKVRNDLRSADVPLESPTVVAEWDSPVKEILTMIKRAHSACKTTQDHAIVVIRRDETIYSLIASDENVAILGDFINSNEVHAQSHIGDVYEALLPRKKWQIDGGIENPAAPRESVGLNFGNIKFELV